MSETDTVFVYSGPENAWIPSDQYPIPNRGMNFGDGLFETMVFDGVKIRFFGFHLDRMRQGMRMLGIIASGVNFLELEGWIRTHYYGRKLRIRWNLFRGGSGKYSPQTHEASQTLHIQDLTLAPPIKSKASFSEKVSLFASPWSRFKTLNALPYVLVAIERVERDLDELILLDYRGKVAEASSSNIFWRKGKKIFTPGLSCGAIAGVGRRAILEKLHRYVTEGDFTSNELLRADQVWISNATGISYLEKIDSIEFSTEAWGPLVDIFD
jgi:branched-subunit amino acid aminotransferase/4-amino-4-deoxychorismate lyase